MANNPGNDNVPKFHRGDSIGAGTLNKIVDMILKRLTGSDPIFVSSVKGGIVVSMKETFRGTKTLIVPAKIASVVGDGAYTVDTYEAGYDNPVGRAGFPAKVIDDSVTLVVGAKVSVFSTRTASFIITSGGGGAGIYKVTGGGAGNYTLTPYDFPGGTATGTGVTGCKENNNATVPTDQWVEATLRPDGKLWFSMPLGCPT